MRKRRTRNHIIADLSANHSERFIFLTGHATDRVVSDYGVDLILWTFDREGQIESGHVLLQLKATDHLPVLKDEQTIAFPVQRADLEVWTVETMPLILIVYDAQKDKAYWLYIQAYFNQRPELSLTAAGETVTIYLPMAQILDESAIQKFQHFKQEVQRQMEGKIRYDEN